MNTLDAVMLLACRQADPEARAAIRKTLESRREKRTMPYSDHQGAAAVAIVDRWLPPGREEAGTTQLSLAPVPSGCRH